MNNSVKKRAAMAKKRYGSTTKGNGGGKRAAKAKTTIRPARINGSWGLRYKRKY